MESDHRIAGYSIVTVAISALAGAIGTVGAALGAPAGAIVLGEMCGLACLVAFTLLIWAAIEDGKHAVRVTAE